MTTTSATVQTWRYHLPNSRGEGWVIAFLDSIGCFSVLSDYGNYGHRWPQAGWGPGDFRSFLVQCGDDYILRKLAPQRAYDGAETLINVKRAIIEARRACARRNRHNGHAVSWSRERAREEWDRLDEFDIDYIENFVRWADATGLDEPWEYQCNGPDRDAVAFIEQVMPRLRKAIEADLVRGEPDVRHVG